MQKRIPIHAALVHLRERAGYATQEAYAEAVGCAQSAISRAESGAHTPRLETIQRYADMAGEPILIELRPRCAPAIVADHDARVMAKKS